MDENDTFCMYFRNPFEYLQGMGNTLFPRRHVIKYIIKVVTQKRLHRALKNQQKIRQMPYFCYPSADLKFSQNGGALLKMALLHQNLGHTNKYTRGGI